MQHSVDAMPPSVFVEYCSRQTAVLRSVPQQRMAHAIVKPLHGVPQVNYYECLQTKHVTDRDTQLKKKHHKRSHEK